MMINYDSEKDLLTLDDGKTKVSFVPWVIMDLLNSEPGSMFIFGKDEDGGAVWRSYGASTVRAMAEIGMEVK